VNRCLDGFVQFALSAPGSCVAVARVSVAGADKPFFILEYLSINELTWGRVLKELEDVGVIERLPLDRVKVANTGLWIFLRNGPLQLKFGLAAGHLLIDKLGTYNPNAESPVLPFFSTDSYCTVSRETAESFVQELRSVFRSCRIRAQRDA
jgi:hypothetical protein